MRRNIHYLGTGENNLARYEYKEHNFGFDHAIDQPREKLQRSDYVSAHDNGG
jgi:hypothetical protein